MLRTDVNERTRTQMVVSTVQHLTFLNAREEGRCLHSLCITLLILLRFVATTHTRGDIMRPDQASQIVETAATIWPNVKDTDATCRAWFLALSKTDFYDATDAIGILSRTRKTVHVSDIVKTAEQVRRDLVRSLPPTPEPPDELADDPAAYIQWRKTARERQLWHARIERHAVAV